MKARGFAPWSFAHAVVWLAAVSLSAAPPDVTLVSPRAGDSSVNHGDVVYLKADARDFDGSVARVEFYDQATNLLAMATNAPFEGWWTPLTNSTYHYYLTAVAIDDAMERATSAVVHVWAYTFGPRMLTWEPPAVNTQVGEWNTRDFNWRTGGQFTHFRPGDAVTINNPFRVFIGTDGVSGSVAPAGVVRVPGGVVEAGDILTGSLEVQRALFTNYANSLSFPGGTRVGTSGHLTFSPNLASNDAALHFGTGPITLSANSRFEFALDTNQTATLLNDIGCADIGAPYTLTMAPMWRSNAVARFSGTLDLSGMCRVEIQSGLQYFSPEGMRDPDYHEWAGPIVLNQIRPINQLGMFLWGAYRSRGLMLSGNIRDGIGAYTNRLVLQTYAVPVIRLTGSNTYGHGTLIDSSPSAPQGWVEVAPQSSLGRGNVEVRGPLRLMGNGNIHSNATVSIAGGRVIIDPGVKARASRLALLGGPIHTIGLFTQTNAPNWFRSNGTLRLPAFNLPPVVTISNLNNGAELAADVLRVRTHVADSDSYIERVDLWLNGSIVATRTNWPYDFSVKTTATGDATLQAAVYDDDGGSSFSPVVHVRIAPPRFDGIRQIDTNVVALHFRATADPGLVLEATESLIAPVWTNLGTFRAAAGPIGSFTVTNQIPPAQAGRFYRLRTP